MLGAHKKRPRFPEGIQFGFKFGKVMGFAYALPILPCYPAGG